MTKAAGFWEATWQEDTPCREHERGAFTLLMSGNRGIVVNYVMIDIMQWQRVDEIPFSICGKIVLERDE